MAIKCCETCGWWVEQPIQCKNPDVCRWSKGGCTGWKPEKEQPMTNADRIRSMTDEELAGFLPGYKFGYNCPPGERKGCPGECVPCWFAWLQQEVKDDQRRSNKVPDG